MSEQDRNLMARARNLLSQVDVNSSPEYLASSAALCEELTSALAYKRIPCAIVREDTGRKWAELMQEMPPGSLLYAAPPASRDAAAEDVVTAEMIEAAESVEDLYKRGTPETWGKVYRAMRAAAPSAIYPVVKESLTTEAAPQAEDQTERDLAINAETCAVCGEGKALLLRSCSCCGSFYAGSVEMRANQKQANREPLTQEQIDEMAHKQGDYDSVFRCWLFNSDTDRRYNLTNFARAIERAHGIGKEPSK